MHVRSFASPIAVGAGMVLATMAMGQKLPTGTQVAFKELDVRVPAAAMAAVPANHTDPNKVLHLSISLPYGDQAGMEAFADSVSDPYSPNYRQFITPQEVGERFGLPIEKVGAVKAYLESQGFKIRLVGANRLSILADATVAQAEAAFKTTINDYPAKVSPDGKPFFAFSKPVQLPTTISGVVLDVAGMESLTKPIPKALTPTQTRTLYNLAPAYSAGFQGQGRNIAISNWDGYRLTNVPLYYSAFGLPTPSGGVGSNIRVVTVSGGAGSGTASGEGDLDIQMVLGMAPLCTFTIYDGGSSDLIGVLTAEVNENLADVISESYGWNLSASTATSAHNLHLSMTAQGITYMAASGDSGTTIEPYSYPNYDPEVLMVGGTVATVGTSGTRTTEVGWSGSGGGWSTNTATFNKLPSWQVGTGVPTTTNYRLSPDVALHASSSTGAYQFYLSGSLSSAYVGTSFACPVFAGALGAAEQKIISLGGLPANSAGKQRFGRIQDLFYSQNGRSDVWFDVTSGSNGKLPSGTTSNAGVGWDFVTGWGAINFDAFVTTQVSTTPDFTVSTTPSSVTVLPGGTAAYTSTVTALNGFSGITTLSVSGLPSGATATFSPTSITGSGTSALSVVTTSSTPVGSYTLTITGTSGSLVHTSTVTLIVGTPDFTISASPTTRSITRGSSTTYTVTITGTNGFSGAVALSATGVTSPTTATFSPTSVTGSGTSTLTIKTTNRSTRGTFTVTIKGTSGSLSHTTTVSLTVR